MFSNLNKRMSELNEQRRYIEAEIKKGVRLSTNSLLSSNSEGDGSDKSSSNESADSDLF